MVTKCIELEYPYDGRRKATIVTNDEVICKRLAENPDTKIEVFIIEEETNVPIEEVEKTDVNFNRK